MKSRSNSVVDFGGGPAHEQDRHVVLHTRERSFVRLVAAFELEKTGCLAHVVLFSIVSGGDLAPAAHRALNDAAAGTAKGDVLLERAANQAASTSLFAFFAAISPSARLYSVGNTFTN